MHWAALLAALPLAAATVTFEGNIGPNLSHGSEVKIKWDTDSEPVKILLSSGTQGNNPYALIDVICTIWVTNNTNQACTTDKEEVTWTPNNDVPIGVYSFMAIDARGVRSFSNFVNIVQGGSSTTAPASSTSTTATANQSTTGTTATTGSNTSGTSTSSSSSTSPSPIGQDSATTDGSSSGLSTGAKIGIGIGAAVGGIVLLGGLGLLVFRMGKKAAANKNKKDDGSLGEDGEASTSTAGAVGAAALARKKTDDSAENDIGPAEMPAPVAVHEAPDYKHLDTPGANEFFSELDATGGSFIIPSSRPGTPRITVTSPEGNSAGSTDDPVATVNDEPTTGAARDVPSASAITPESATTEADGNVSPTSPAAAKALTDAPVSPIEPAGTSPADEANGNSSHTSTAVKTGDK